MPVRMNIFEHAELLPGFVSARRNATRTIPPPRPHGKRRLSEGCRTTVRRDGTLVMVFIVARAAARYEVLVADITTLDVDAIDAR